MRLGVDLTARALAKAAASSGSVGDIAVLPGFYNLMADTTSSNVAVTADYAVIRNSSGTTKTLLDIDIDLDVTIGTTLLDDGTTATANDTWYKVWLIYNPTTETQQLILSAESSTAPTLPSGYTHYVFVMCIRGTGGKLYHLRKTDDKRVQCVVDGTVLTGLRLMASGTAGSLSIPTYIGIDTSSFIPPTATIIHGVAWTNNSGNVLVAPNGNYGEYANNTKFPPVEFRPGSSSNSFMFIFTLESDSIYWASGSSYGRIGCFGWEDNL